MNENNKTNLPTQGNDEQPKTLSEKQLNEIQQNSKRMKATAGKVRALNERELKTAIRELKNVQDENYSYAEMSASMTELFKMYPECRFLFKSNLKRLMWSVRPRIWDWTSEANVWRKTFFVIMWHIFPKDKHQDLPNCDYGSIMTEVVHFNISFHNGIYSSRQIKIMDRMITLIEDCYKEAINKKRRVITRCDDILNSKI